MKTLHYTADSPRRLDSFLLKSVPGLSPGLLHKYLRQNKIKLNGKKQPLATRLQKGDEIRLYLPEELDLSPAVLLTVLYEDERLLAIDKPAGIPAEDKKQRANPRTALALAQRYLAQKGENAAALALCHRLDTGTSGVLLLAKDAEMLDFVSGLIREHLLQKEYVCVTFGQPRPVQGVLTGYLHKDAERGRVYIHAQKGGGGLYVETRYKTLAVSGRLALLQVDLITGRTHQIRAHLAQQGTPILGDSKYGNQAANRELHCRYQCLCALAVRFPDSLPGAFAAYDGLCIHCEKPWYYPQILDETLQ